VADRALKVRATLEMLAEAGGAPARIAADGATVANGYGFERFELGDGELDQVIAGRESGQTVNDVLLAALGLTIDRWNLDRDQPTGRIAFMMPVNLLRPSRWATPGRCARSGSPHRRGCRSEPPSAWPRCPAACSSRCATGTRCWTLTPPGASPRYTVRP